MHLCAPELSRVKGYDCYDRSVGDLRCGLSVDGQERSVAHRSERSSKRTLSNVARERRHKDGEARLLDVRSIGG